MSQYLTSTPPSMLHPAASQTYPEGSKFINDYAGVPVMMGGEETAWYEDVLNTAGDVVEVGGTVTKAGKEIATYFNGETPGTGAPDSGSPTGLPYGGSGESGGGASGEKDYTWYYVGGGAIALLAIWYFMK